MSDDRIAEDLKRAEAMIEGAMKPDKESLTTHWKAEALHLLAKFNEVADERDELKQLAEKREDALARNNKTVEHLLQRAEKAEAELAKEGAEWACVDCGYSDDGFITVENKCYAEPTDYDIECPECHSRNTTEGRANALTEIARKLQQAVKERDELRLMGEKVNAIRNSNHVRNVGGDYDTCARCGLDLRNPIHHRIDGGTLMTQQALAAKGESHPADCMCHLCLDNHQAKANPLWDGPLCTHGAVPGTCGICAMQAKGETK